MCEFISFKIESTPDGLKIHTAPSLSDHSDIKELGFEGEWRDDGTLEVRVPPEVSDHKATELENWIRKEYKTRENMVDKLIMHYLDSGVLPGHFWEHSKLDDRKLRLFACDCAFRVLPLFENQYPGDLRPRKSIEVAILFADGKATNEERAAAGDAAGDAAWAAAGDAAKDAAWVAARDAAKDAAWAAAGDAARAAARDAAWGAEKKWQAEKLLEYLR